MIELHFENSFHAEYFPSEFRINGILESLAADILSEKPLLKAIGREGAGKSLLCALLENRLSESHRVVALPHFVGAFEDLVQALCLELEAATEALGHGGEPVDRVRRLIAQQRQGGKKVLLLVDEAEKMFQATLEQLIISCGHVREGFGCTLLLVGRPELNANLKRIDFLSADVVFSNAYILEDFTESETRQYLRFRTSTAGMSRERFAEVFSDSAMTKIFQVAKGNLRMTNILAEEAIRTFSTEKSFMVLLDHVEPEKVVVSQHWGTHFRRIVRLLQGNRLLSCALVGGVVALLVFSLYPGSSGDQLPSVPGHGSSPQSFHTTATLALQQRIKRDGEAIFRQRVSAASQWLTGSHQGQYTIQLMLLASPAAELSLAETLASDEYAPILDQVYILQKSTTPPNLFVFYGTYDNLDAARDARNSMPVFLRKHQPYPLPVDEALRKVEP